MEPRASYIFVGSFVLILLASLFAFIIWVAKLQLDEANDEYLVYFTGSVTGLQEGSPVRYRGIPVGTVTDVRLDPSNVSRVRASVELKEGTPVKADSIASLELQGLTGGSYVQISGGTEESPLLRDNDQNGTPVIPSKPSSLSEVVNNAPQLLARSMELVDRLGALVTPENRENIAATLANTRRATENLANASEDLTQTLRTFNALAAGVTQKTMPKVDDALTEARSTLIAFQANLKTLVETTVETEKALKTAAGQFGSLAADNRQAIRDFASTGLYDTTQLINQLRELSDRLARVLTRFENDPTSLLFGGARQGVQVPGK